VVEEVELCLAQLEQRHVSHRAHVQRATIAEHIEGARGIQSSKISRELVRGRPIHSLCQHQCTRQ
jgi:predicted DNA-binding protein (UPF0251 family)